MTEGTTRTLKWMTGGFRRSSKDEASESPAPAPVQTAPDKTWGDRLEDRTGHSQRTIGLAIGVAIIFLLWIGWTGYIWSENGSTAAIGVLISWPAALAAVMLVTAPFIGGRGRRPPPPRGRARLRRGDRSGRDVCRPGAGGEGEDTKDEADAKDEDDTKDEAESSDEDEDESADDDDAESEEDDSESDDEPEEKAS